jgi:hypothetical protein
MRILTAPLDAARGPRAFIGSGIPDRTPEIPALISHLGIENRVGASFDVGAVIGSRHVFLNGRASIAQDIEMTAALPATGRPPPLTGAERMRRHRERKRTGLLCFKIELTENVINELVRRKRLSPDYRADPNAVGQALQRYLEYTMW